MSGFHFSKIRIATIFIVLLMMTVVNAAPPAPLVLVSSSNPYAGCAIGGPGTNYTNAEVEPFVAINPINSRNVIGVWQQDRWGDGGAHGLAAGYSFDGGKSW